jgi:spore maturation protein SpmA
MLLNYIWLSFFLIAFVAALVQFFFLGNTEIFQTLGGSIFDSAKTGFELSIGLTGLMTFWLGLVKVGERSGLVGGLSRFLSPFLGKFFPEVPKDHPAIGQIALNFSANMLGLDNAATPLGLKAMESLQELNPKKDTASNAQIMFLVLNTAGLTLIPVTVFLYRAQAGAANPSDVYIPILLTTFFGTLAGLLSVSVIQRINFFQPWIIIPLFIFVALISLMMVGLHYVSQDKLGMISSVAGNGLLLLVIIIFLLSGMIKKLNVFDVFIEGAKEGFKVAVGIIPYLVAILVGVSAFRASGSMDLLLNGLTTFFHWLDWRTEWVPSVPTAIMKSMSGAGARATMLEVLNNKATGGPDSFIGRLVSIFQGSSDTTLYILAVYFGSVGIKNSRYALACGLFADLVAVIAGIVIAYIFFG